MAAGNRHLRGRIGHRDHWPRSEPSPASFLRERASFGGIRCGDAGVEAGPGGFVSGGFIAVCFIKDRLVGERARERAFRRREIDTRGAIRSRRGRVQSSRCGQGCRRIEIACLAGISAHRAGSRSPSQGRGGIRLVGDPQGTAQRYALAGDRMRRRCAQSGSDREATLRPAFFAACGGARSAQSAVGSVLLAGVSSAGPPGGFGQRRGSALRDGGPARIRDCGAVAGALRSLWIYRRGDSGGFEVENDHAARGRHAGSHAVFRGRTL